MIIFQLAYRNLVGAGLRTWLNVIVLSFSFVAIIGIRGMHDGMQEQIVHAMIDGEYGGGQFWYEKYDRYDPFTLDEAHGLIPEKLRTAIEQQDVTPILIIKGSIYPNGRIQQVMIKGIAPDQKILNIPTQYLSGDNDEIVALIGSRMARSTGLKIGDYVTLRWRDINGTFDARDVRIAQVMNTSVPTIDNGQVWLNLNVLQKLTGMTDQATVVVVEKNWENQLAIPAWPFKDTNYLLQDMYDVVKSKRTSSLILFGILLFMAMLAIFNTQILSIFRRRKEIGTLMALGMTRPAVIQLFTLEGALHSIGAVLVAAIYGAPLLGLFAKYGLELPKSMDSYGMALGEKMFPVYSGGLILATTIIILITTTIVSYLPTRKISKLKPTDALKGKIA
jgi:ABC-type lipoprotein release transport system permease subunit